MNYTYGRMSKIHWGKHSYGNPLVRGDISDVYIGKYTSIAQDVVLDCGFHHNADFVSTFPFNAIFNRPEITSHPKTKGDIHIGNDVWIGEGSMIMGGVTIGDGAVIGARSVVTKNVEPYAIVGGSPAYLIRYRFNIFRRWDLLEMKWWDWPEEEIKELIPDLMSNNVEGFIKYANEKKAVI